MNQVQEPESTQTETHLASTQDDKPTTETRGANVPCPSCEVDRTQ